MRGMGGVVSGQKCGGWRVELSSKVNLCTARERPWLPLRRELDCCIKDLSNKTEGEITRGCCLHQRVGAHKMIQVSLLFCTRLYPLLSHILGVSLLPSRRFNPLYAAPPCPLAVLRSRFGFAILAFADGSSRNSSLHPPPEALGISTLEQGSRERTAPLCAIPHFLIYHVLRA